MEHASKEIEKEKIRNRYKGVSPDLLEVIPAEERVDILQDDREKRVGVYVRVSTDDPRQRPRPNQNISQFVFSEPVSFPSWFLSNFSLSQDNAIVSPLIYITSKNFIFIFLPHT